MRDRLGDARSSLDHMAEQIARQDESSRHLIASIAGGLAALDEQFLAFADQGDQRSLAIGDNLARLRGELEAITLHSDGSGAGLGELAERTAAAAANGSTSSPARCAPTSPARSATPRRARRGCSTRPSRRKRRIGRVARDIAAETSDKIGQGAAAVEAQHDRLAALLAAVDTGVGGAERRLTELSAAISSAQDEAGRLAGRNRPGAGRGAGPGQGSRRARRERAREAISAVVPEAAGQLSEAARTALGARGPGQRRHPARRARADRRPRRRGGPRRVERLVQQMLSIGQSAAALEAHFDRSREDNRRERDSEDFARRVSLLIDSMHSAAIDVGKILADEVDDKSWAAYLKGDRGVFTRRAVRLIGVKRGARDRRRITKATPSSSDRSTATSTISRRCCAG